MSAIRYIVVSEFAGKIDQLPGWEFMSPEQFLKSPFAQEGTEAGKRKPNRVKVINLCRSYEYLSRGYYVSMLAEARGYQCIPAVSNIILLLWRRNYEFAVAELADLLNRQFAGEEGEPAIRTYTTFFGRHRNASIEPVSRRLFDLFRFPIISFEVKYTGNGKWSLGKVEGQSFSALHEEQFPAFMAHLQEFTGSAWRQKSASKLPEKHWIGILHDPKEQNAPSDKQALKRFIKVGKSMGLWVELITRSDFSSLLEYDALLIRETTAINNHTFRFAAKAEHEGIPVIDDTHSIIRCCNKVFLNDLMVANGIAVPKTVIMDKRDSLETVEQQINYPMVLKIPDGSFSRGVFKVRDRVEFKSRSAEMLKKSDIVVCQEFLHSEFDWRVGVLAGEILFVNKYYMAEGHWQIYNHEANKTAEKVGAHEGIDPARAPGHILELALQATTKIGNGLYGVDIKQLPNGSAVVIEVNDNPNIDHGVEDMHLGDELYRKVLAHMVRLIES